MHKQYVVSDPLFSRPPYQYLVSQIVLINISSTIFLHAILQILIVFLSRLCYICLIDHYSLLTASSLPCRKIPALLTVSVPDFMSVTVTRKPFPSGVYVIFGTRPVCLRKENTSMYSNNHSQDSRLREYPDTTSPGSTDFEDATGEIPYGLTNDYMFRAVFQSSNKALRGLICSLLHLADSEVTSVEITNPILLGDSIDDKEFRLDIHLLLNDRTRINLEMQIANRLNWPNRSVMYLCRSYDQLNRGQDYKDAGPAVHIGLLDYTLFEDHPEFYAAYKLINIKNHRVYNDDLTLYVADLTRIDLATEEDKRYRIDSWARLMKASTWEELRMTASEDEALYETAKALYYTCSDEEIRIRCLEREEYYQDLRNYERAIEQERSDRELERLEHEQDLRNYERAIEQERLEHEQDLQNYRRTLEQERSKHEQDLQNYRRTLEQERSEHEQQRLEHEQDKHHYEQQITQLQLEIEQLKLNR